MTGWGDFERQAPDFAAAGARLLGVGVAYLATTRRDGGPRVHPVTPVLGGGGAYVAIPPASPKAHDLLRDGRFALHALPGENDEEFMVYGRARRVDDPAERAAVTDAAGHVIRPDDLVFALEFDRALWGHWEHVGQPDTYPVRRWWREPAA